MVGLMIFFLVTPLIYWLSSWIWVNTVAEKEAEHKIENPDSYRFEIFTVCLWVYFFITICIAVFSATNSDGEGEAFLFALGLPSFAAIPPYLIYRDKVKEQGFQKNGIGIIEGEIVMKSGGGEIHFSEITGKPVGGSNYNPDDWEDHPEFVGKSNAELARAIGGKKMLDYKKIKEKVCYEEKISKNLEDELMSLDINSISIELAEAISEAFFLRAYYAPSYRCDEKKSDICSEGDYLFTEISQAIKDGTWENCKADMRAEIDEFKLMASDFNLSIPEAEHKELFQRRLKEHCESKRIIPPSINTDN